MEINAQFIKQLGVNGRRIKMSRIVSFADQKFSTNSVTALSILLFYLYSAVYACLVFSQFTTLEVVAVSLAFSSVVFIFWSVFNRDDSLLPIALNLKNITGALMVSFLLIMFSNSFGVVFSDYIRTFPVLEAELGLGWHKDTVYHVSLIQSILNFGYPSIAQHGHPFTAYHALTHFSDALILSVVGLDPYDSYGLFANFKIFAFLVSLLVFVNAVVGGRGFIAFLASVMLLFPLVIGTWHVVGSHGLWLTNILVVFASPYLYRALMSEESNSVAQFSMFLLIVVFVSFGKISSGVMLCVFVSALAFLKQPLSLRFYIFALLAALFFYAYNKVFSTSYGTQVAVVFKNLTLRTAYDYLAQPSGMWSKHISTFVAALVVLGALAYATPSKNNLRLLAAVLLSIIPLYLLTVVIVGLNMSDIWYFHYGLAFVLFLFIFQSVTDNAILLSQGFSSFNTAVGRSTYRLLMTLGVLCLAYIGQGLYHSNFNLFAMGYDSVIRQIRYANNHPFLQVNKKLGFGHQLSIYTISSGSSSKLPTAANPGYLQALKGDLEALLVERNIRKSDALLFLPKEVFDSEVKALGGDEWANGMLMYALLGIPLVNGMHSIGRAYGLADYTKDSFRVSAEDFNERNACNSFDVKILIEVHSIIRRDLRVYTCSDSN